MIDSEEVVLDAENSHPTMENFKVREDSGGCVLNTPLQKQLKLKIGAQVMLTYNIDTLDCLTNGSLGEVVEFKIGKWGKVAKIIVDFKNENCGKSRRLLQDLEYKEKYPSKFVVSIEKIQFSYSLGSEKSKQSLQAVCIQFPLRLAFAATAHKCQGMTVPKPLPLIVDIRNAFEAAMVYVILSRVQALIQLFIIAYLDISKIYCNENALEEVERLNSKSLNNSWSEWFVPVSDDNKKVRISFLNIVSLRKHFLDLKADYTLKKSDVICLGETSLFENNKETQELYLSGYNSNFNSCGLKKLSLIHI